MLNRFCLQAVIGHPLTVYGAGGQTRGFLNIRDTLACVELAVANPAERRRVPRLQPVHRAVLGRSSWPSWSRHAGEHLGYSVEIQHVENPRVEKEEHYYNAIHTKLLDLGLEPTLLGEELVESMIARDRAPQGPRDRELDRPPHPLEPGEIALLARALAPAGTIAGPMRAADALMESLKAEGVKDIFGIPGGANLPTYDALVDADFRHIQVRHEQGGGHAAEGYAKASGRVGVAFATSGPGATNLVTAIADAMMDSVPTVFVTGQVRTELIGTDGFQEADILGATLPFVKHSFQVTDPRQIPEYVHEAFHVASTGRPGPVLLDIPQDLSRADIDYEPRTEPVELPGYKPSTEGNIKQIRIAAKALANARRPIFYTGGGVINGNASEELRELAASDRFPVTSTLMGLGAFPASQRALARDARHARHLSPPTTRWTTPT